MSLPVLVAPGTASIFITYSCTPSGLQLEQFYLVPLRSELKGFSSSFSFGLFHRLAPLLLALSRFILAIALGSHGL